MRRAPLGPADLEELYGLRFAAFVRGVTAVVGDGELALDVVQDAFANALRKRRTFRGEGDLEAWVWSIALNLSRDRLRTRMREGRLIDRTAAVDREPSPFEPDHRLERSCSAFPNGSDWPSSSATTPTSPTTRS